MSYLSSELIIAMGGECEPCERHNRSSVKNKMPFKPGEEEILKEHIIKIESIYSIKKVVFITEEESKNIPVSWSDRNEKNEINLKKYLWVIDIEGMKVIKESTPAKSDRKFASHTNITGAEKAIQGGELWFWKINHIFINFHSGRYDDSVDLEEIINTLKYIESLGFIVKLVDDKYQPMLDDL